MALHADGSRLASPLLRTSLHLPSPNMAAIITAPLALGAKVSVRGAKVVQKEAVAAKVVRTAARAEISKGAFVFQTRAARVVRPARRA